MIKHYCCQGATAITDVSPIAPRMRYMDDLDETFDTLSDLTLQQRAVIKERYRFLMIEYRWRCRVYTILFYVLRITMTVGSLAVPAMLSLNNLEDKIIARGLYWATWGLSLAVTTAHGLLTLFKLDKRFFMLHAVAERLRTESWQYLSLSGRYSGHYGGVRPTHRNQYVYYASKIERIRMRHIDDEYVRPAGDADDKKTVRANAASNADGEGGSEKVIGRRNSVSQEVPSPPDQARLRSGMTPGPGAIPDRKVLDRQESDTTIGKGDEIALEIHEKKDDKGAEEAVAAAAAAVPMYDEDGDIVPPASRERNIVLFKAPEV